ncbi:LptF/LptG family permease [Limisalsivibrio acetivorans]|uniref:LptF/LptG family permease n=1 Tax=Limisalsivibrio acetivorans TaxID=1304888 RepID=UPI0003B354EB|nr:LptF/LptG family permease [Limisalsivibrio acetivorans]
MKRFHLYMLRLFIKYTLIVQVFVIILNVIANSFHHTKLMAKYDVSFYSILIFDIIKIPYSIHESMPMAMAITAMLTMVTLVRSNELLAFVTLGGKLRSLVYPFLIIGVFTSGLLVWMGDTVNPWIELERKRYETEVFDREQFVLKGKLTNTWMRSEEGFVHFELIDPIDKSFRGVSRYRLDNSFEIDRLERIESVTPSGDKWKLENIEIFSLVPVPELVEQIDVAVEDNPMFSDLADLPVNQPKFLSIAELGRIIDILENQGLDASKYKLMLYKNFSHALSVIIILLLVFPLSVNYSRHRSYVLSAVYSLSAAFGYWVIMGSAQSIAKTGVVSPLVASITPHILFAGLAFYLIYSRERSS